MRVRAGPVLWALVLVGCGSSEAPAPASPEPEPAAPAERVGPPEDFACPEGATVKGGDKAAAADLWFQPTLPNLQGDGPFLAPDEAPPEEKPVVREMGDRDTVWTCVTADGVRVGPYLARLDDGEGTVTGSFDAGKPSGDWLGVWVVDEPEDGAPAEGAPVKVLDPGADGAADGTPEADGEENGDEDDEEDGAEDAPEEAEPAPETPQDGPPPLPEGTRLMFRGSYGADGARVGVWALGCLPGCSMDRVIEGRFSDSGAMGGRWNWSGDQERVVASYREGKLAGRYVHQWMDEETTGSFYGGKRAGKWVKKKAGEVVETVNHGGPQTARPKKGSKSGRGRK